MSEQLLGDYRSAARLFRKIRAYDRGMWLRRAVYSWLLPAAIVLPLWLLVGWGVFNAGGWAFLWVIFIAVPSVLVGQVVFALLVRARPVARLDRAVSWWDVAGFGVWHGLTIAVGFYPERWFGLLFVLATAAGLAMIPLLLNQLLSETRGSLDGLSTEWTQRNVSSQQRHPEDANVYVVQESPPKTN